MKILITGANGMLGTSLLRFYYGKHEVYALHREKNCLSYCTKDYSLDLEDPVEVKKTIDEVQVVRKASHGQTQRIQARGTLQTADGWQKRYE